MKRYSMIILSVLVILLIEGCTAGPNNIVNVLDISKEPAGFWLGLWHGMIAPITFIISLFSDNIGMYEIHNSGGWYNFGFLLGVGGTFGGGTKGIF